MFFKCQNENRLQAQPLVKGTLLIYTGLPPSFPLKKGQLGQTVYKACS